MPYQIDLVEAYKENKEINLSQFAEGIEYIPLETPQEALIGRNASFYLIDDFIISIAFRQLYLFDRKTGAFIKELKGYGAGPDEYRSTQSYVHANEELGVVYVRNNRDIRWGINAEGAVALEFGTPKGEDGYYIMGFAQLSDDLFVGYQPNPQCDQEVKLIIFNSTGEIIKTYANHLQCVNSDPGSISFDFTEGSFYRWKDQVGFKETYNDTLFMVSADSLSAKAVFNSGEYRLKYEEKKTLENGSTDGYHFLSHFDETNRHLFFQLSFRGRTHSGVYDKYSGKAHIARNGSGETQYFHNDLENFIPFRLGYATDQGELVGNIEAPDVLNWMDDNPEKADQLPEGLKQYLKIKEDDNPIVMVVKLKD